MTPKHIAIALALAAIMFAVAAALGSGLLVCFGAAGTTLAGYVVGYVSH